MIRGVHMLVLIAAVLGACAACTPSVDVRVSALNDGGPRLIGSYAVEAASAELRERELLFREIAAQVELAMDDNGYTRVPVAEEADLILEIEYGVSGPLVELERAPTSSVRIGVGHGFRYGHGFYGPFFHPSYGVRYTSPRTRYVADDRYRTRLRLEATEVNGAGSAPRWELSASATTKTDDLRAVMPFLVYASRNYIGDRTEQAITVKIRVDEPRVARYRSTGRGAER